MSGVIEVHDRLVDLDSLSDNDLVPEDIARRYLGGTVSPISTATLWRGVKSGRYPAPAKVGSQTRRWRVGTLRDCVCKAVEAA